MEAENFQEEKRSFLLDAQWFSAQHYQKHPKSDTEEEDDQAPKSTNHNASLAQSKLHQLTQVFKGEHFLIA